jgi:hypothetical protein
MAKAANRKRGRKTAEKTKRVAKAARGKASEGPTPVPVAAPKEENAWGTPHFWENEAPQTELDPMGFREPESGERFISKPLALAVSVVLVVCIILLVVLFVQSMKNAISSGAVMEPYAESSSFEFETLPPVGWETAAAGWNTRGECLQAHGLDAKTPIFSYLPTCPHCRTMLPVIQELMRGGHGFELVDRTDPANSKMLYACLGGIVGNSVPQLICPNTGNERTGTLTMNEIVEFEQACKNS